jgi:hypothetical protein
MPGHPAYSVPHAIADAGNDLERARVFDFYLFFPTERAAEQAAVELEEVGFCCNIQPGRAPTGSASRPRAWCRARPASPRSAT